jgi:DNA-binding response OmpR family regulator
MRRERILVIEEADVSGEDKCQAIRDVGHSAFLARSIGEGLRSLYEVRPDLIILVKDSFLDSEDDFLLLRQATESPIVAVGPRGDVAEILDSGADSYVCTPTSTVELVATVRALLRRSRTSYDSTGGARSFGAGDLSLRFRRQQH